MDPECGLEEVRNVGIKDGRIAAVTKKAINGRETIGAIFAQLKQGHSIEEMAPRNTWGGQIQ